ncbi:MAG: gluconokinase, GntK/IdnK-type [Porticoccaceae bacterium]|nr:gluconokinase, GntK/IdnK-type [Porticoccaceae bacterium]
MTLSEEVYRPNAEVDPLLIVVMGVSGTGKSTLANEFSLRHQFTYLDADSFHSEQAIQQMSQGIPLTNTQRIPWINRIYEQLRKYRQQHKNCILAYSGLKKAHREVIFSAYTHRLGVLLNADPQLIRERFAQRSDHFMSSKLLDNQFAEMEPFDNNESLLNLNISCSVEELIEQLQNFISAKALKF